MDFIVLCMWTIRLCFLGLELDEAIIYPFCRRKACCYGIVKINNQSDRHREILAAINLSTHTFDLRTCVQKGLSSNGNFSIMGLVRSSFILRTAVVAVFLLTVLGPQSTQSCKYKMNITFADHFAFIWLYYNDYLGPMTGWVEDLIIMIMQLQLFLETKWKMLITV